jgi:hypothetical protein
MLKLRTETSVNIIALAMVFPLLALLCAPLVALNVFLHPNGNGSSYYKLLSTAAQKVWQDKTDRPLMFVVGDRGLAVGIAFYSPDHPIVNPFDTISKRSTEVFPRISRNTEEVRRSGAIAVCRGSASECAWLAQVVPSETPERFQEMTLSRQFLGWPGNAAKFTLVFLAPKSEP